MELQPIEFEICAELEKMLTSYNSYGGGMFYSDKDALLTLIGMVVRKDIILTKELHPYDMDIYDNPEAVAIYRDLEPHTRWKRFQNTDISRHRMNALWQLREFGEPDYGEYIEYPDALCAVQCGDISPQEILKLFYRCEALKALYVVQYPFYNEQHTQAYFRMEITENGKETVARYNEAMMYKIYQLCHKSRLFKDNHAKDGDSHGQKEPSSD